MTDPDDMIEPVVCPWCDEWAELQDTRHAWDEDAHQWALVCPDCARDGKPS